MKLFCKLLGHTWVHKSEDPKIRWTTSKEMTELVATAEGEPLYYQECARCKSRRPYEADDADGLRRAS